MTQVNNAIFSTIQTHDVLFTEVCCNHRLLENCHNYYQNVYSERREDDSEAS